MSVYISNYGCLVQSDELYHHGILGMRWGIRRFQPYPKGYSGNGKFTGKTPTKEDDYNRRLQKIFRDFPGVAKNENYLSWNKEQTRKIVDILEEADYYKTPEKIAQGKNKVDGYFDNIIDNLYAKSQKTPLTEKEVDRLRSAINGKLDQRQKDAAINLYAKSKSLEYRMSEMEQEWMNSAAKDPEIKKMINTWTGDGGELYEKLQELRPNKELESLFSKSTEADDNMRKGFTAIGKDAIPSKYNERLSRLTYKPYKSNFTVHGFIYDHAFGSIQDAVERFESRAKSMAKSGKTYEQIANSLGISESSVGKLVNL